MLHNSWLGLKILELFLLNTKEFRSLVKLVPYFYHFSRISYGFPNLIRKRKEEISNSVGPKPAQVGPTAAESRPRPRARWRLCRKALEVLSNRKRVRLLFPGVTDISQKGPLVSVYSVFHVLDGVQARPCSGEQLRRPIEAKTGANLWLRPKPSPMNVFPNLIALLVD